MSNTTRRQCSAGVTLPFPVWPQIPDGVIEAFNAALRESRNDPSILNGLNGAGPIQDFELAFSQFVGAKHALAVNSGASALHPALIAAGVGPGDEVILSAHGWGQILVFIDALDAVPVFADIDPSTLGLDSNLVAERITRRTRAIVVTHFAGCPADVETVLTLVQQSVAYVIEDCTQALGARIKDRPVGTMGHLGVFSLGPRKLLPCGQGGVLVTNDYTLFQRALVAGQHPDRACLQVVDPRQARSISEFFWSYRIHPAAAATGTAMMPHLTQWSRERDENHQRLCHVLKRVPAVVAANTSPGSSHAWGGLALMTYRRHPNGDVTREDYASLLRQQGVPISPGPVVTPLHLRSEVASRWGEQSLCPATKRRCAEEKLVVRDTIGWIGDQSSLVEQVGTAFGSVHRTKAQTIKRPTARPPRHGLVVVPQTAH